MRGTSPRELISIEMVSSLNVSVINSRVVNFESHSLPGLFIVFLSRTTHGVGNGRWFLPIKS